MGLFNSRKPTWPCTLFSLTLLCVLLNSASCSSSLAADTDPEDNSEDRESYTAYVNVTYTDPQTSRTVTDSREMGFYAHNSLTDSVVGLVVLVRDKDNVTNGCNKPLNRVPPKTKWIALVQRGVCRFHDKIYNAAKVRNASAVVIYDTNTKGELLVMDQNVENVISIFISKDDGERLATLLDNGTRVMMNISRGSLQNPSSLHEQFNKTSVLFVSISFIVLMVVSLAWLIFYYVQRFRYVHAKERLSRRLAGAAKKAISKIPLRTIKSGDKETQADAQQCAVCIESFVPSEVVRELPCKHLFHKSCVDPWLLDQRSCPMCKMDILKAYGLQVPGAPTHTNTDDNMEVTSTQSPDEDSGAEPRRSIQMVHVESGVIFHHREESVGSPSSASSLQLDTTVKRKRNPSSDSIASHESLKSNESCAEFESLITVKSKDGRKSSECSGDELKVETSDV